MNGQEGAPLSSRQAPVFLEGHELTPAARQLTALSHGSNHLCVVRAHNIYMEICWGFSVVGVRDHERS